jgi:radical SAM protein with 4Fe4S-binding SPASM domain
MSITRQYEGYKPINLVGGKNVVVREEAIKTEAHSYDKCNATPFFWAYIMASGDVYSCSAYLLDERFRLGNIAGETFRSIWEGERRRRNFDLVKRHLDIRDCRVNCRMDKANKFLWGFDHQPHLNFV